MRKQPNSAIKQYLNTKMETRKIQVPNDVLIAEIKHMLDKGHSATFRVKGYSMRPFLENERDIVKIEQTPAESIKENDVVLAEIATKKYVLHRVIDRTDNQLTLRGDGNIQGVEHCLDTDVVGIATAFYRKGRAKPDTINGVKWKLYSNIWLFLTPFRRILLGLYRRLPFKL